MKAEAAATSAEEKHQAKNGENEAALSAHNG
jgi:hypothetical protein